MVAAALVQTDEFLGGPGLSDKDAKALLETSGGPVAMPIEDIQATLDRLSMTCTAVRSLGMVNGEAGPEYFFALNVGEFEIWYGLTIVDGKVVDVE